MPVALPPGRARLATRPNLTGSSRTPKTIGIAVVAALAASAPAVNGRGDHGHATADEVGHQRWQSIVLAFQPVVLDRHVLAFDGAGFVEAFTERSANARGARGPLAADECNGRRRRLLGTSRKRPCDPCACRAAEQRDELASLQPIEMHPRPLANSGPAYRINEDRGRACCGAKFTSG